MCMYIHQLTVYERFDKSLKALQLGIRTSQYIVLRMLCGCIDQRLSYEAYSVHLIQLLHRKLIV